MEPELLVEQGYSPRAGLAVVMQVGRVELKKLIFSPLTVGMIGFYLIAALQYMGSSSDAFWILGFLALLMGISIFVIANRNALRSRTDGLEELFYLVGLAIMIACLTILRSSRRRFAPGWVAVATGALVAVGAGSLQAAAA